MTRICSYRAFFLVSDWYNNSRKRLGIVVIHLFFRKIDKVPGIQNIKIYSFKDLKIATDDFSPSNKIGEGGFGCVYKGKLKGGTIAAIKVLSAESRQGVREFLTELTVISDIKHPNLVNLLGCCVEGNHRILVYVYLENNSLSQSLLGGIKNSLEFDWQTRSRICIGVARGLAYLHEEVRPYIVHRDIKASNILLDNDLNAKISDFGLAKLVPANMTHVSTRVAGTIGYLAPEYAVRGQLTRRADVYSFGVLILEIVSGRCNTNTRLPLEEQYLLERVWALYELGEMERLIDERLGVYDTKEALRFMKVGLICTQDAPKLRPPMSVVVKMLTGERAVDDKVITKPGFISDFMDLKVRAPTETPKNLSSIISTPLFSQDFSSSSKNTNSSTAASSQNFTTFNSVSS